MAAELYYRSLGVPRSNGTVFKDVWRLGSDFKEMRESFQQHSLLSNIVMNFKDGSALEFRMATHKCARCDQPLRRLVEGYYILGDTTESGLYCITGSIPAPPHIPEDL